MSTNTQPAPAAPAHHPICDRKRFNPLCQGCEAERAASQATAAPVASAPGAELLIGVAVGMDHEGATVVIQQPLAGGRVAVIYTGTHGKGESMGRAVLCTSDQVAVPAEGGELLTPGQRLNIAAAVRKAFPHVQVPHNVYDQIAWNTEQACYVAASRQLAEAMKPLIEYPLAVGSPSDTVLIGSGNWKLTAGDIERARHAAGVVPQLARPAVPIAAPVADDGKRVLLEEAARFEQFFSLSDMLDVAYITDSLRVAAGDQPVHDTRAIAHQPTQAARDVLEERRRQVEAEGWTPAHDDAHDDASMARAAACYALPAPMLLLEERPQAYDKSLGRGETPVWAHAQFNVPTMWPRSWRPSWWKPKDRRRDLVRAGALILAEIERLDRAAPVTHQGEGTNG
jgi:hypothetical protein